MCSVEGCLSEKLARGMCRKHYLRWWKHGDPRVVKKPVQLKGKDSPNYKHGMWNHSLYKTWINMLDRCYNENSEHYKYYGARGITVCDEWRDIAIFVADMGDRPAGFSIDRIDNSKGYFKDNCAWSSSTDQSRNRRNVLLTIQDAEAIRGMPRRAKNGRGPGYSRQEIADMYGVSVSTVKKVLSEEYWARRS